MKWVARASVGFGQVILLHLSRSCYSQWQPRDQVCSRYARALVDISRTNSLIRVEVIVFEQRITSLQPCTEPPEAGTVGPAEQQHVLIQPYSQPAVWHTGESKFVSNVYVLIRVSEQA